MDHTKAGVKNENENENENTFERLNHALDDLWVRILQRAREISVILTVTGNTVCIYSCPFFLLTTKLFRLNANKFKGFTLVPQGCVPHPPVGLLAWVWE